MAKRNDPRNRTNQHETRAMLSPILSDKSHGRHRLGVLESPLQIQKWIAAISFPGYDGVQKRRYSKRAFERRFGVRTIRCRKEYDNERQIEVNHRGSTDSKKFH
jgi:hypothetical protein